MVGRKICSPHPWWEHKQKFWFYWLYLTEFLLNQVIVKLASDIWVIVLVRSLWFFAILKHLNWEQCHNSYWQSNVTWISLDGKRWNFYNLYTNYFTITLGSRKTWNLDPSMTQNYIVLFFYVHFQVFLQHHTVHSIWIEISRRSASLTEIKEWYRYRRFKWKIDHTDSSS